MELLEILFEIQWKQQTSILIVLLNQACQKTTTNFHWKIWLDQNRHIVRSFQFIMKSLKNAKESSNTLKILKVFFFFPIFDSTII